MHRALIYVFLSLVLPVSLAAQEAADSVVVPPGKVIEMEGAFLQPMQERDSVLVADQFIYGFELKEVMEGTMLLLPEIPEKQDPRMMFLTPWQLDTVKVHKQKKGQPRLMDLRGGTVITSFEEGLYELPRIMVGKVNGEGGIDTLLFNALRLDVKTMPVDTATFKPHDIKAQIRYPLTFEEVFPWLLAGWFAAVLVILAVCLVMMHRKKNDPANVCKDPPHIVALRKLDQYRGNKLWAPEKQKTFYSGVTDTLREYIASRYGISAMEMTTAEIFKDMKDTDAPENLLSEMRELFERADFVKFAKYVASDEDNAAALPVAVRFVTETYQAELEEEPQEEDGQNKEGGE